MNLENIRLLIGQSYWKFAKTMPHIPHWYTLRMNAKHDQDFVTLVEFIRSHGYDENWGKRVHRYLDLDGWKYWTMGTRLESTVLINRARQERKPRPITLNPSPFRASVDWHEVYCIETRKMLLKQNELNLDLTDEQSERR